MDTHCIILLYDWSSEGRNSLGNITQSFPCDGTFITEISQRRKKPRRDSKENLTLFSDNIQASWHESQRRSSKVGVSLTFHTRAVSNIPQFDCCHWKPRRLGRVSAVDSNMKKIINNFCCVISSFQIPIYIDAAAFQGASFYWKIAQVSKVCLSSHWRHCKQDFSAAPSRRHQDLLTTFQANLNDCVGIVVSLTDKSCYFDFMQPLNCRLWELIYTFDLFHALYLLRKWDAIFQELYCLERQGWPCYFFVSIMNTNKE